MRGLRCCARMLAAGLLPAGAGAVVAFGSSDPDFNAALVNPPSGPLENSGLQFVADFAALMAVPIGPLHFLTAAHIGTAPNLVFRGVVYPVVASEQVPGTDLLVHRIDPGPNGPFPAWAPLFTRVAGSGSEVGRTMVVFGKGLRRGAEVQVGGRLAGWLWGEPDLVLRWGVNRVSANQFFGGLGQVLLATFDAPETGGLGDSEAHLSQFDSGGAMFIQEAGVWKLAGVHFGVEGPFSASADGSMPFFATLFDGRGLWVQDDSGAFVPISGAAPQPSAFGSSSVADSLGPILAILGQPNATIDTFANWRAATFTFAQQALPAVSGAAADPDSDGLPNLLEYASGTPPWASQVAVATPGVVQVDGSDYPSLTYRRAKGVGEVEFRVEVSADLQVWDGAPGTTVTVGTVDGADVDLVTVRAAFPLQSGAARYLRLRVSLLPP